MKSKASFSTKSIRKNDTSFDDSGKSKRIMLLASVASVLASIGLALQSSESSIMTAASLMGVISCRMAGLPGFFAGI